uniref:anti-sigma factor family protein n=1 Tax=Pelomonas sp. KK5 TaxID=1855730 RepID=UPI0035144087
VQAWRAVRWPPGQELVAAHVQALRDGPLIQVASSDRHTVKPWFQGRIDYAPTVPDALPGFTLLGGRVQSLAGQPTAVLALQLRLHQIDVFIRPADGVQPPERSQQRGFNIVQWRDGAMQYWAVSDVDGADLLRLARQWPAPLH